MKVSSILNPLIIVCLLLTSLLLQDQSFQVTKNGNDDNSGSQSSPWESIQHAMDNATIGSTVFIHKGIYKEAVYVNVSGNPNGYITYKAFENDEVIIDAEGQTSTAIIELYGENEL